MAVQPSLFDKQIVPLFEETRADWLERARATARQIAAQRGQVTINDVRDECPPPEDVDPRVMGAVLRAPAFKVVGYVRSSRADCHNRPIAVFALAQEAA